MPVLRAGRTLGVLVVQNKTMRHYRDDEVEALETTAMVIAEMIATGDLARLTRPGLELDLRRPVSFTGLSFNDGVGLGHVVLHEPRIVVTNLFNEDSEEEVRRLETSLGSLRLSIDDMLERRDVAFEGEHREVLEAYRMFANDRGWVRRLEEAVRNGLTAEAAVEKVQSDMRARMLHMTDPYLRERMSDFDDLANRLLRQLMGRGPDDVAASLPKDAIIVARSMGAAELLDYPRDKLRGAGAGGRRRHQPCRHRRARHGHSGRRPDEGRRFHVGKRRRHHRRRRGRHASICGRSPISRRPMPKRSGSGRGGRKLYRELRKKPSVTKDGVQVDLLMNAGPGRRPAAAGRGGRGRHRPVPHRTAVHGRLDLPARRGAGEALPRRARRGARQAGHLPHHRYRRRQGAALLQERRRRKKTRRSAGARSG